MFCTAPKSYDLGRPGAGRCHGRGESHLSGRLRGTLFGSVSPTGRGGARRAIGCLRRIAIAAPDSVWAARLIDVAQWANHTQTLGPVEVRSVVPAVPHEYRYAQGVVVELRSGPPAIRVEGTAGWIASRGWGGRLQAATASLLDRRAADAFPGEPCPGGPYRNFLDCVKSRQCVRVPAEVAHRRRRLPIWAAWRFASTGGCSGIRTASTSSTTPRPTGCGADGQPRGWREAAEPSAFRVVCGGAALLHGNEVRSPRIIPFCPRFSQPLAKRFATGYGRGVRSISLGDEIMHAEAKTCFRTRSWMVLAAAAILCGAAQAEEKSSDMALPMLPGPVSADDAVAQAVQVSAVVPRRQAGPLRPLGTAMRADDGRLVRAEHVYPGASAI